MALSLAPVQESAPSPESTASSESVRCNHFVHVDVWMLVTHLLEHGLVCVSGVNLSIIIRSRYLQTSSELSGLLVRGVSTHLSRVPLDLNLEFSSDAPIVFRWLCLGDQTCITTVISMVLSVCWACGSCLALQQRQTIWPMSCTIGNSTVFLRN